jgi:hypothetical protein
LSVLAKLFAGKEALRRSFVTSVGCNLAEMLMLMLEGLCERRETESGLCLRLRVGSMTDKITEKSLYTLLLARTFVLIPLYK